MVNVRFGTRTVDPVRRYSRNILKPTAGRKQEGQKSGVSMHRLLVILLSRRRISV